MSNSRESAWTDQHLASYLLGRLPETEAERLDELSITDDAMADRLRVMEDDLVDAYIAGSLDRERAEAFEAFYLGTRHRRDKVDSARRFLDAIDRQTPPASAVPTVVSARPVPAGAGNLIHGSFGLRLRRAWLPGAAAVLLLSCGVLLLQDIGLRRILSTARRESALAERQARSLAEQLQQQRAAITAMAQRPDSRASVPPPAAPIAIVLAPQTRGGDVTTVAVPLNAELLALDLRIERDGVAKYGVTLEDLATNRIVWRHEGVAADPQRRPATVPVALPGKLLKPHHYLLELSAGTAGASEVVASYVFQVERR